MTPGPDSPQGPPQIGDNKVSLGEMIDDMLPDGDPHERTDFALDIHNEYVVGEENLDTIIRNKETLQSIARHKIGSHGACPQEDEIVVTFSRDESDSMVNVHIYVFPPVVSSENMNKSVWMMNKVLDDNTPNELTADWYSGGPVPTELDDVAYSVTISPIDRIMDLIESQVDG